MQHLLNLVLRVLFYFSLILINENISVLVNNNKNTVPNIVSDLPCLCLDCRYQLSAEQRFCYDQWFQFCFGAQHQITLKMHKYPCMEISNKSVLEKKKHARTHTHLHTHAIKPKHFKERICWFLNNHDRFKTVRFKTSSLRCLIFTF